MRMDAIPDPIDRTGWKDWKRRKRRAGESKEHIFFFFRCSQVRPRTLHAYRRVSFLRPLQAVSHPLSATTLGASRMRVDQAEHSFCYQLSVAAACNICVCADNISDRAPACKASPFVSYARSLGLGLLV